MKCLDCKKRKAILKYADSVMDSAHGFVIDLCRQCYIKRVEKYLENCKKNLKEQKKLLKEET